MEYEYRKVTALVRPGVLEKVEAALQAIRVRGVSVSAVKGYGEYANFFERDWMDPQSRIEIFARVEEVPLIVKTILSAASTGGAGDGIVSVLPVEQVWRIRTRELIAKEDV